MTYDLGDTVPLAITVTDAANQPTTPATVVLTIELPDGSTVTPVLTLAGVGVYTCNYLTTVPGRHVTRWVSTAPGTAFSDVFDVRPASPVFIVSLADAKAYLNIPATSTVYDEELRGFIETSTEVVEEISGRVVSVRTVTEQHDARGLAVALNFAPVAALTSITDVDGVTAWDVAAYRVDGPSGVVSPRAGARPLCGRVEIVYSAGMITPPRRYVQAGLVTLRHLWESQRVPVGGRGVGQAAADTPTVTVSGWSVPRAAVDLIGPRLQGIA